jgi:uncharacterized protein (DUF952 family)
MLWAGAQQDDPMTLIYKIIPRSAWIQATENGVFHGASIDLSDGYIHLSDASQAEETARRHFAGQTDLLLVAFDPAVFKESLKWEASRGGALFPHVYGSINPKLATWVKDLPLQNGIHVFPEGWAE